MASVNIIFTRGRLPGFHGVNPFSCDLFRGVAQAVFCRPRGRGFRPLLLALVFLLLGSAVQAQTATPGSKFLWTQGTDAATAQAYTWKVYNDGAAIGVMLTAVTCVANSPATTATCSVAIPAYTPGPHSVTVSATNAAGEGPKSDALAFTMVALPAKPGTPSIQ